MTLAERSANTGTQFVYLVHPNPNVKEPVETRLRDVPNVVLADPFEYLTFINVLKISTPVLTDSGGVQEEAPSFSIPMLVMRLLLSVPRGSRQE